jgi:hypothetical protein
VRDARKFMQREALEQPYDLVFLDAYTAGSTIPPHLMTREFFALCAASLAEGGVVLANVIGSYGQPDGKDGIEGAQHRTLGGAIRSLRATQLLPYAWNFPIIYRPGYTAGTFNQVLGESRNNIVVAAAHPLSPREFPAGWARLRAWAPFPELSLGTWTSATYHLVRGERGDEITTTVPAAPIDQALPELAKALPPQQLPADGAQHVQRAVKSDSTLAEQVRRAALALEAGHPELAGRLASWRALEGAGMVVRVDTDWVKFPREVVRLALLIAQDGQMHSADALVSPIDPPGAERPAEREPSWIIRDAPLFTDQKPNADIWNR